MASTIGKNKTDRIFDALMNAAGAELLGIRLQTGEQSFHLDTYSAEDFSILLATLRPPNPSM